ncbi:MAG: hypothetical protein MJK04_34495 [Psychrosphaera sp.]|nr:hypothetical protein [Psychrosphaera sp.]
MLVMLAPPKEAKLSDKSCYDYIRDLPVEVGKTRVCMGGVVELKYEVDEILHGNYKGEYIDIIDFYDAGGFPIYLKESTIYLALIKENGHYFLAHHARFVGVEALAFVCGENLNPFVVDDSKHAPPYRKVPPKSCNKAVEFEELKRYFKNPLW